MPTRRPPVLLPLASLALLFAAATRPLSASAPPALIRAAQSANGESLVTVDFDLAPAQDSGGGRRILGTTFHIARHDPSRNNTRDRLDAPGTLWSERWSLTLSGADSLGPPRWPILSDDGRTLLLVSVTPASAGAAVLSIYREEQLRGRFVRSYTLANLWPAQRIPHDLIDMGYTPQWFVGSRFTFTPDGDLLLYRTPWGDTLTIRLSDGVLNPPPATAR